MFNVQFLQKEARVNVVLGTYIHIELNFLAVEIKKKCANFLKPEISKALRNDNEWGNISRLLLCEWQNLLFVRILAFVVSHKLSKKSIIKY